MAWPTIFANLAGGNQPLSIFDVMFQQVANMIAIPCAASGQNTITLTAIGTAPIITSYTFGNFLRFIAAQTSNGPVSAQFGTLGFVNVYKADGLTQASTGDIVQGQEYVLINNPTLNSNTGGWYLENAAVPASVPAGGGLFNGRINNNVVTPNTQLDVSATELVMNAASGAPLRSVNSSFTINLATTGLNGIDTGAIASNKAYNIWAISNGSTVAGLASLSSTFGGLVLPGGYLFGKRIGSWMTAVASAQLMGGRQAGKRFQYIAGLAQTLTTSTELITGNSGAPTTPTWTSVPNLTNFIPPTVGEIWLTLTLGSQGGGVVSAIAAPTNGYGGVNATSLPPPLAVSSFQTTGAGVNNSNSFNVMGKFTYTGSVFYASNAAAGSGLYIDGWEELI